MTVPDVVYKYVAGQSHHLSILRSLQIRFTQPEDLNDPHDGIPGLQAPADIESFVDAIVARSTVGGRIPGLTAEQQADGRRKTIAQYRADPDALLKQVSRVVHAKMNTVGILSLASSNANMPLWAHYANSHRGFVIGLRSDRAPLIKRAGELGSEGVVAAVRYVASPVVAPLEDFQLPTDFYFTKSEPWKYEEEWRIVRRLSHCDVALPDSGGMARYHLCQLDPEAIVRVDVGFAAPDAMVQEIQALTGPSTRLRHVEVYRAQMSTDRTALTFARL